MRPVFDDLATTRFMHRADGFDTVLHVAHHEWFGIRSATSCLPGHKLLIPADRALLADEYDEVLDWIRDNAIDRVVFQGYSINADLLLQQIKARFQQAVDCYVVTHANTTQFEHSFEIEQQTRIVNRIRYGALKRVGSVKPDFGKAFPEFWGPTLLNYAPNIDPVMQPGKDDGVTAYVPLDTNWRKNMYTNIVAGAICDKVDTVKTAKFPYGLPDIFDTRKLVLTGYLRGDDLLEEMGRSTLLLTATLAECQPMTQLEALAMGTPVLTGPLRLSEFESDELTDLSTAQTLDNPYLMSQQIERLVDAITADPAAITAMIGDHLTRRHAIATDRYKEFLEL